MSNPSNPKSAQAILIELRDGQVMNKLTYAIHDAINAVRAIGKAATVTLKIKVDNVSANSQNLIEPPITMIAEVETKLPKPDPTATLFFVDEDGNPNRKSSGKQAELGLTIAASN